MLLDNPQPPEGGTRRKRINSVFKLNQERIRVITGLLLITSYRPFRGWGENKKAHPINQMSFNILRYSISKLESDLSASDSIVRDGIGTLPGLCKPGRLSRLHRAITLSLS
jgi:hypothetical protein